MLSIPLLCLRLMRTMLHTRWATYRIAGYIGGNNVWQIAGKSAIGGYEFGGYGTIATPSPGVYAVSAILADLILAV